MTVNQERIQLLDILRGVAILGLLAVGIVDFSMPTVAQQNPFAFKDSILNEWFFSFVHVFFEGKFLCILSLVFGISMPLFAERIKRKKKNPKVIFYWRMFWLLVIGWIHTNLFWEGDLLSLFAVGGVLLFVLQNLKAKYLYMMSGGLFLLNILLTILLQHFWIGSSIDIAPDIYAHWNPTMHDVTADVQRHLSSWFDFYFNYQWYEQASVRLYYAFLMDYHLRIISMMFLGMALGKGRKVFHILESKIKVSYLVIGGLVSIALSTADLIYNFYYDYDVQHSVFKGRIFNQIGSFTASLTYVGIIAMLVQKRIVSKYLRYLFASVGRMAISNYMMQSVICILIFYGFGLGYYGSMNRAELFGLFLLVTIAQMMFSGLWMKYFCAGPVEYLWRSIADFQWHPLLKKKLYEKQRRENIERQTSAL